MTKFFSMIFFSVAMLFEVTGSFAQQTSEFFPPIVRVSHHIFYDYTQTHAVKDVLITRFGVVKVNLYGKKTSSKELIPVLKSYLRDPHAIKVSDRLLTTAAKKYRQLTQLGLIYQNQKSAQQAYHEMKAEQYWKPFHGRLSISGRQVKVSF